MNVMLVCRYVLECCNCGVIYKSRQYWYGNQDPEKSVVRTEIRHVWPGVCLYRVEILPSIELDACFRQIY